VRTGRKAAAANIDIETCVHFDRFVDTGDPYDI
jgi:hypothetical protein